MTSRPIVTGPAAGRVGTVEMLMVKAEHPTRVENAGQGKNVFRPMTLPFLACGGPFGTRMGGCGRVHIRRRWAGLGPVVSGAATDAGQ